MLKATVTPLKVFLLGLGASLLFGCTSMTQLPEGSSYAEVRAQYGAPQSECQQEHQKLAVWSQQPMGYYAWLGRFDSNDRLLEVQQVLSDPHFNQLEQSSWNKEQVWCHFGPPGEQAPAPYLGTLMDTWTYRYKQSGVWPMMMNIFFDEHEQVHALQRSMDPRDNDGRLLFSW